MRSRVGIAALLALATVAVYAPVREHAFLIYDDALYITANPAIALGLSREGIAWALTSTHDGLYIPASWLSYLLDAELWGISAPAILSTNVVYHVAAGLLLFFALSRATGATGAAAFVSGVFLLHPAHVESVAWVSERKDVLCGLFWMATLVGYVHYAKRPSGLRYAAVAVAFVLALASKPAAVTLPFVLLLLDAWPLGRLSWERSVVVRRTLEKLPLLALTAVAVGITYAVQRADGVMSTFEALPLGARIANAAHAYASYLGISLWPVSLSVFYPQEARSAVETGVVLAFGVGVTIGALWAGRRRPWLAVGWLWFLGTLVPVIGLVQVGQQAMADRYLYLPLIGLAIALAWTLAGLAERVGRGPLVAAGVTTLALCAALATQQVRVWRDSVSLFRHAVAIDADNRVARGNLGIAYLDAAEREAGVRELARALDLEGGPETHPAAVWRYLMERASGWLGQGRPAFAIVHAEAALGVRPDSHRTHALLARAYRAQGRGEVAATHEELARKARAGL